MARMTCLFAMIWVIFLSGLSDELNARGFLRILPARVERHIACVTGARVGDAQAGCLAHFQRLKRQQAGCCRVLLLPRETMDDLAEVRKEMAQKWRKRKRLENQPDSDASTRKKHTETLQPSAGLRETPNSISGVGDKKRSSTPASASQDSVAENPRCSQEQGSFAATSETEKNSFDLLTWNVDGLDEVLLKTRSESVAATITELSPGVVFLQEIVPASLDLLRSKLSAAYDFVVPMKNGREETSSYFCVVLLCKKEFVLKSAKTKWFDNSMMGRHLIVCRASHTSLPSEEMVFITSHLESMKDYKSARQLQLQAALRTLEKQATLGVTACGVFGGDLNIRDSEIHADCLGHHTHDIWTYCGSPKACQYTWDCLSNDNIQMRGKFKPRLRFDRLYWWESPKGSSSGNQVCGFWIPRKICLVGTRRLPCGRFTSDHYGLLSTFERDVRGKRGNET